MCCCNYDYNLFRLQNKHNKESKISKAILAGIIDKAKDHIVNEYADGMVEHIQSDGFKEVLASKINKKIDIPFVSEEKEQIFFEKCVDLVTDVIEGIVKK